MPPDETAEFDDLRKEDVNAIWRLFIEYGRGHLPQFVIGALASVVQMGMELIPAYILSIAIDALFFDSRAFSLPLVPDDALPAEPEAQFLLAGTILAGAYGINAFTGWLNSYMWNNFSQYFQHDVRVDTYDAMQRRELDFFDNKQTGEVMSILNNDVNQLENFLTSNLNTLITITVRVGGMGLVMLLINWRLALIPVAVIPVLAYLSYWFVNVIHPKYREVRSTVGDLNSRLENNIGGIETVKSFTTERFETDRVEEVSRDYLDHQWDAITTRITFFPTLRIITSLGYIGVFFVGGWWIVVGEPPHPFFQGPGQGELTAGVLVLFLSYSRRFTYPMRQVGQVINSYQYAEAAGERIVGLLDMEPRVKDDPDAEDLTDVEGHVVYEDVDFAYENEDGESERVLTDVSLEAEPGDYVGLVGPTGAGKSTLMKLLLRFYDVDRGEIRVDGRDVEEVTLRSLRQAIGYVSQDSYLFYGTVTENIAYGLPDVDEEAVREAARIAGAHEFVTDLPEGYDTMVGERGVKLSGGQRQRVSIARAVLRDPEILVLDEATSHVDNETEVVIQRALAKLTENRTTFAIAHRLSTVKGADRILVMDDGEVVERGTHEDLLAEDGLYANLWGVQVGDVEDLPEEFVERTARHRSWAESPD